MAEHLVRRVQGAARGEEKSFRRPCWADSVLRVSCVVSAAAFRVVVCCTSGLSKISAPAAKSSTDDLPVEEGARRRFMQS